LLEHFSHWGQVPEHLPPQPSDAPHFLLVQSGWQVVQKPDLQIWLKAAQLEHATPPTPQAESEVPGPQVLLAKQHPAQLAGPHTHLSGPDGASGGSGLSGAGFESGGVFLSGFCAPSFTGPALSLATMTPSRAAPSPIPLPPLSCR